MAHRFYFAIGTVALIVIALAIVRRRIRNRHHKIASYAVVVNRSGQKYLFLNIERYSDDEIFINYPRQPHSPKNWKPHTSVHRDGQIHDKDFGKKTIVRRIAPPNQSFIGPENITTISMNPNQWKSIRKKIKPNTYASICEIDVVKHSLNTKHSQIQLDLVGPNVNPHVMGRTLSQSFIKDRKPWIVITLAEP